MFLSKSTNILVNLVLTVFITLNIFLLPIFILSQFPVVKLVQSLSHDSQFNFFDSKTLEQITVQSYDLTIHGTKIEDQTLLTTDEQKHLTDVFYLLEKLYIFFLCIFVLNVILLMKNGNINKTLIFTRVRNLLFFVLLCLILAAIFFDQFFLIFHSVVFPGGNWSFPIESALIQAFPPNFWLWQVYLWFGIDLCILLILSAYLAIIKTKNNS